ncbi:hypothetical protein [Myxococcus sp. SDU36]|uniref:hypothetical protein n=1 Tax=Myxococcus sp. SDU36 TaxID=2831967 RepID=UPI0025431AB7|nr:hypothetical protein [Myxococcus sp. SDU36]WIG97913.1 hypothetical protein KGD87_11295 [Myxococcus sp. SDU36]
MLSRRRILVADVPSGVQTLRSVLGDTVELLPASVMADALKCLREGVELAVCGVHFDESRMFDFLRTVKADPVTRGIPVLCFRDLDSTLAPMLLQSLEISCRALGAVGFIDIHDLKSRHGSGNADARFRKAIAAALRTKDDLPG